MTLHWQWEKKRGGVTRRRIGWYTLDQCLDLLRQGYHGRLLA
jgi:hypothetical protein